LIITPSDPPGSFVDVSSTNTTKKTERVVFSTRATNKQSLLDHLISKKNTVHIHVLISIPMSTYFHRMTESVDIEIHDEVTPRYQRRQKPE
jgi:hypothetical protein